MVDYGNVVTILYVSRRRTMPLIRSLVRFVGWMGHTISKQSTLD